jgi:hypothetical protein
MLHPERNGVILLITHSTKRFYYFCPLLITGNNSQQNEKSSKVKGWRVSGKYGVAVIKISIQRRLNR